MRALAAPMVAALEAGTVVMVQLISIDFGIGDPYRFNTSSWTLQYGGEPWYAAMSASGALGSISGIKDASGAPQGLQLELYGGSAERISAALDEAGIVQGAQVRVYLALLDKDSYQLVDVAQEWRGQLDTMTLADDGDRAVIRVTAESAAVNLLRGRPRTYTDGDQQAVWPGDAAFDQVVAQSDKQVTWPAREWFLR